jgi:hypothetical protein
MESPPPNDVECAVGEKGETTAGPHLSAAEKDFLFVCTGNNTAEQTSEGAVFVAYVRHRIYSSKQPYGQILHHNYYPDAQIVDRVFYFFSAILETYRANPSISLNRVLQQLSKSVIKEPTTPDEQTLTRQYLFAALGTATLLYVPAPAPAKCCFEIDSQGAKCFTQTTVAMTLASRPPDELLRVLGEVLPRAVTPLTDCLQAPGRDAPIKFHVSILNVATLRYLADIEIVWVDSIGAHLDFDPTIPALYLFRMPSFSKLHETNGSILSMSVFQFPSTRFTCSPSDFWGTDTASQPHQRVLYRLRATHS